MHSAKDTVANINLDYLMEQIKATVALATQLAEPIAANNSP